MTLQPGPGTRDVAAEVRGAARRQAAAWAGAGPAILASVAVALLMVVFIVLDYKLDQNPHRIIKVGLGALMMVTVVLRPRFGLLLLPVITPFLLWIPPTPIPGLNTLNVLLLAVFGSYAVTQVVNHQPFLRGGRLGLIVATLLGLAALSIIRGAAAPTGYGYSPASATLILIRSTTTFATYFIVLAMARGERDRRWITWAVLIGLLLESLATIKLGRSGSGQRATGSIGQANELGAYLAMFSILAAAIAVGVRSWFARITAALMYVLGAFGILLSVSRGGMLALLGGTVLVLWRSSRWLLGVLLVVLLASPLWAPDYVVQRITSSRQQADSDDGLSVDNAAALRLMTWRAVADVVTHHPIDGVGFTGLANVLPDIGASMGVEVKDSAHNTYLRMLAEMGVLGLLAFLVTLWKLWSLTNLAVKKARSRFDRAIAVGTGGAVFSMAISCAFGDRFWSPVVVSSLWVMAALVEDSLNQPARGDGA